MENFHFSNWKCVNQTLAWLKNNAICVCFANQNSAFKVSTSKLPTFKVRTSNFKMRVFTFAVSAKSHYVASLCATFILTISVWRKTCVNWKVRVSNSPRLSFRSHHETFPRIVVEIPFNLADWKLKFSCGFKFFRVYIGNSSDAGRSPLFGATMNDTTFFRFARIDLYWFFQYFVWCGNSSQSFTTKTFFLNLKGFVKSEWGMLRNPWWSICVS